MKKPFVIHPLLLTIFPILFLYAHNIDVVSISSIFHPMGIALCSAFFLWFFLGWLIKDNIKSGIITSILLLLFFSYGHSHGLLLEWVIKEWGVRAEGLEKFVMQQSANLHGPLMLSYCFIGGALIACIIKTGHRLFNLTKLMNVIAVVLCLCSLLDIVIYNLKKAPIHPYWLNQKSQSAGTEHVSQMPDIYYIILDGYGRKDILKEFYDYDNSEFINFLKKRRFYVARKSRSNFAWTYLSFASSLNFQYINYLSDKVGRKSQDRRIPYKMIKNNKVARFLKSKGYRFVHFNSTWGATLSNPFADIEISCKKGIFQNEFYRVLAATTFLKFWDSLVKPDLATCHLFNFKKLESLPNLKGPKFVFMHVIPPHHPYLFDRNGNVKRHAYISNQFEFHKHLWREKDQYIDQLMFVNKKMEAVIEAILDKSEIPPIIILQSDHGPTVVDVSWDSYLKARMAILNAYYLPRNSDFLYDTITPVNTFRLIFEHYFGMTYPLLPDESYYSTYELPYEFSRVSIN